MNDQTSVSMEELGQDLARIRELAGLSQQRLAEELRVDPSRVSRIESGKLNLRAVEQDKHLKAINSDLSNAYRRYLLLDWKKLPRPSFWHPEWQVLHTGDGALVRLQTLASRLPKGSPLLPQLDMHRQSLHLALKYLEDVQHDLALIGDVGVGKTTAICSLSDLVLQLGEVDHLADKMVLEIGQGGTTLCEVRIQKGPRFGLVIDPLPENNIRALIGDFCADLTDAQSEEDADENGGHRGVTEEIDRALRNLMGLAISEGKSTEGKTVYIDPIDKIKEQFETREELQAELFNLMHIQDRNRTQLWHEVSSGLPPLDWLKKTFQDVNNGLRSDVCLPERIDVVIPDAIMGANPYEIRLVDTKGLDRTAIRRDIQNRVDDPRSLLVLCTRFNDFATSLQGLIEHAYKTGSRRALADRTILLVLPQGEEARSMKTPLRERVKADEAGYELNVRRLGPKLERIHAEKVPVFHLNATSEVDVKAVTGQLLHKIQEVRQSYSKQITDIDTLIKEVSQNHEEALAQAANAEVRRQLTMFLERCDSLPPQGKPIYMAFLHAVKTVHPRTVHASMVRNGDWQNLNTYLFLGIGTSTDAQSRSQKFFSQLEGITEQMLADGNLAPAHGFLKQLANNAARWREQFLETSRRVGEELLRPPLYGAHTLWDHCAAEWGQGKGYRDRVAELLQQEGFEEPDRLKGLQLLESHVRKEWETKVLDQFRKLCIT